MRLAIFAKTFNRTSVEECLGAVRESGLDAVQFNLSITGLETVPVSTPEDVLARAREAFAASGVEAVALSGTFNAAHPDPAVRAVHVQRFANVCHAAAFLDIPLVTLSTGSRDPEDMWRWHPGNSTPEAWADSLATLKLLSVIAADHDLQLAFEPERNNVVSTADLALQMLEQVGSERLGTIFDAANLLTEPIVAEAAVEATIVTAAQQLQSTIVLAHAKELRFPEQELPAGSGLVPWSLVVEQLKVVGYNGPLVIHGLKQSDVGAAVSTLARELQRAA